MNIVICLVTCPSKDVGASLARLVVAERLAACVNLIPGVQSVYRWKEEVTVDEEVLLLIKTTEGAVERLRNRLLELHPYEVPEFVSLRPSMVSEPYAKWVLGAVQAGDAS